MKFRYRKYFKGHPHFTPLKLFIQECPLGDWFVLYQMSKNLNKRFFMGFITRLARKINPDLELGNSDDITHLLNVKTQKKLDYTRKKSRALNISDVMRSPADTVMRSLSIPIQEE